jgi:hypothetical protein
MTQYLDQLSERDFLKVGLIMKHLKIGDDEFWDFYTTECELRVTTTSLSTNKHLLSILNTHLIPFLMKRIPKNDEITLREKVKSNLSKIGVIDVSES